MRQIDAIPPEGRLTGLRHAWVILALLRGILGTAHLRTQRTRTSIDANNYRPLKVAPEFAAMAG
jgi:hypothetical protein